MEIANFQHPDSIWTWKSNNRRRRAALWLPYFQAVEKVPRKADRYKFFYRGGDVEVLLKQIDFIMLYGASGDLPVVFLDRLSAYRIPLLLHRRNMPRPYVFFPDGGALDTDILTPQIAARQNLIRRCYIARTLIRERFRGMETTVPIPETMLLRLKRARSIAKIRAVEAQISQRYWRAWFEGIGYPGVSRRERTNPVNQALNAGSFFLFGIILRWVLLHRMAPCHGFLHEPTTYPALVYDLIEPYRYIIEDAVKQAIQEDWDGADNDALTAASISRMKDRLDSIIYVPSTRQEVRTKNLLHGVVLALRSYLLADARRLVVPVEGQKKGGRPVKVSYRLPGQI